MAALATQTVGLAGTVATFAAAAGGGDTFLPTNNTWIEVINGSGASITATIVTPGTVTGQAVADIAVAVAAGTTRKIGPFPGSLVARASDGRADITYSAVTTVTVGVFELDPAVG